MRLVELGYEVEEAVAALPDGRLASVFFDVDDGGKAAVRIDLSVPVQFVLLGEEVEGYVIVRDAGVRESKVA